MKCQILSLLEHLDLGKRQSGTSLSVLVVCTGSLIFTCFILDCLENELISEAKSGMPLSSLDIVCLGLNMMAGGHFQRIGAIVRGLSQSSVCRALNG